MSAQSTMARRRHELLLDVDKVRKQFGGLVAVNDVSFQVKAGEIIGLDGIVSDRHTCDAVGPLCDQVHRCDIPIHRVLEEASRPHRGFRAPCQHTHAAYE